MSLSVQPHKGTVGPSSCSQPGSFLPPPSPTTWQRPTYLVGGGMSQDASRLASPADSGNTNIREHLTFCGWAPLSKLAPLPKSLGCSLPVGAGWPESSSPLHTPYLHSRSCLPISQLLVGLLWCQLLSPVLGWVTCSPSLHLSSCLGLSNPHVHTLSTYQLNSILLGH